MTAPRFPAVNRWYEGKHLRAGSKLVGRTQLLDEIMQALEDDGLGETRSLALTGIGGIG